MIEIHVTGWRLARSPAFLAAAAILRPVVPAGDARARERRGLMLPREVN
jgi:hypothetical protein